MQLLGLAVVVGIVLSRIQALPVPACSLRVPTGTATPEGDVGASILAPDSAVRVADSRAEGGEDSEQEAGLTLDALLADVDEDYSGLAGLAESLRLRGRLALLRPWLEARAARGSVDAAVYRTLAVLSGESARRVLAPPGDAQTFFEAIP